jgi:hypothetical protein
VCPFYDDEFGVLVYGDPADDVAEATAAVYAWAKLGWGSYWPDDGPPSMRVVDRGWWRWVPGGPKHRREYSVMLMIAEPRSRGSFQGVICDA